MIVVYIFYHTSCYHVIFFCLPIPHKLPLLSVMFSLWIIGCMYPGAIRRQGPNTFVETLYFNTEKVRHPRLSDKRHICELLAEGWEVASQKMGRKKDTCGRVNECEGTTVNTNLAHPEWEPFAEAKLGS